MKHRTHTINWKSKTSFSTHGLIWCDFYLLCASLSVFCSSRLIQEIRKALNSLEIGWLTDHSWLLLKFLKLFGIDVSCALLLGCVCALFSLLLRLLLSANAIWIQCKLTCACWLLYTLRLNGLIKQKNNKTILQSLDDDDDDDDGLTGFKKGREKNRLIFLITQTRAHTHLNLIECHWQAQTYSNRFGFFPASKSKNDFKKSRYSQQAKPNEGTNKTERKEESKISVKWSTDRHTKSIRKMACVAHKHTHNFNWLNSFNWILCRH